MDSSLRSSQAMIPILFVFAMVTGCDPEKSRWRDAQGENSVSAFEEFLSAYPDGAFADSADFAIEALHFRTATSEGTVQALEEFQESFPDGFLSDSVSRVLDSLLPDEPQITDFTLHSTSALDCEMEFTVSIRHRSGALERFSDDLMVMMTGRGELVWDMARRDEAVPRSPNHTTVRATFRDLRIDRLWCSGPLSTTLHLLEKEGGEMASPFQTIVDFGGS